jgi:hypothetical protein
MVLGIGCRGPTNRSFSSRTPVRQAPLRERRSSLWPFCRRGCYSHRRACNDAGNSHCTFRTISNTKVVLKLSPHLHRHGFWKGITSLVVGRCSEGVHNALWLRPSLGANLTHLLALAEAPVIASALASRDLSSMGWGGLRACARWDASVGKRSTRRERRQSAQCWLRSSSAPRLAWHSSRTQWRASRSASSSATCTPNTRSKNFARDFV